MGRAVDTILCASTQGGASAFPTTLPAIAPDSLTIRSVVGESSARIMAVPYQSNATAQKLRITSPLLHDNVTGFTWVPGENPGLFLVPKETGISVKEQDTLLVQGACAAATTITAGVVVDYDDIRGTSADLYRWGDISGDIKYLKAVEVDLNAIAVGAWTDTLITTTENQFHADASYAVLGYDCSQSLAMVGLKGVCTGNLRFCGPGSGTTVDITDYFVNFAEYHNMPYIPVFQANDRQSVYVSAANGVAVGGGAATVTLIVAELSHKK